MTDTLDARMRRLMKLHPPIRQGALQWRGLVGLAHRVVHQLDPRLRCAVKLRPNPFRGHVRRIGSCVTFTVDAALRRDERDAVLAHEIGHVGLGHYQLDDETYYYTDDPQDDPLEWEAELFEAVVRRSMFFPMEWIIPPEQLPLGLPRPHVGISTRNVAAEAERIRAGRVRTAGQGKPKPEVQALLLRLFEDHGI